MKLTLKNKLKLCFEILFMSNKFGYPAEEKRLSTFQKGYYAGIKDERLSAKDSFTHY